MAVKTLLAALLVPAGALAVNQTRGGRNDTTRMPPPPGLNDTIRIIGGIDAKEGDFPYMLSLQVQARGELIHLSGGSLLDATTVLIAGLCVRFPSQFAI